MTIDPRQKEVLEHNIDCLKDIYLRLKDQIDVDDFEWLGDVIFNLLNRLHSILLELGIDDSFLKEGIEERATDKLIENFGTLTKFNIKMNTYQAMKCLDRCLAEKTGRCNYPVSSGIYEQIINGEITFNEAVETILNENNE